jgi:hypothetical protein
MDTKEVIARFETERQALAMNGPSEHCEGAGLLAQLSRAAPIS